MGSASKWLSEKALSRLRSLPRVELNNLTPPPPRPLNRTAPPRSQRDSKTHGCGSNGNKSRGWWPALGSEHLRTPMAYRTVKEPHYNFAWQLKRQYPPLSLKTLQLMIDTGRLDASKPIDLAAIANTKVFPINPSHQHFGVNLTDEGADWFKAKVNVEVQWANEQSIAAVERNGGVITTAYYDLDCVVALSNAEKWFRSGKAVPRRLTPPSDCIGFYSDPTNRGYLADPKLIALERAKLALKYGYQVDDVEENATHLREIKDPKQVFYGLEPGWVIDLTDKVIYKPTDPALVDFYRS